MARFLQFVKYYMPTTKQVRYRCCALFLVLFCSIGEINTLYAQSGTITVIAGKQYSTSIGHQQRWGKHYRKEWATPVTAKMVMLDTLASVLTPYEEGGGRQSRSIRLRDVNGREYVL